MRHLLVDISAHGFGHVAQTAAVLNALDTRGIRITIRSMTPADVLRRRIRPDFELMPYQQDNGMVMHDALRVDVAASMRWYENFHANYAQRKAEAVQALELLQADVVFANVPYLSLAAAGETATPAIALCSLNWADVFGAYCGHLPGADRIRADILSAYAQATVFLQPIPSMDMSAQLRGRTLAPLASIGQRQPERLRHCAGKPACTRFVLVSLGGMSMDYPLQYWPSLPDVCWIFPDTALSRQTRADCLPASLFRLDYVDLLASCDLVMTKTGYGTQTEAVVNRIPTLCITRPEWPEEPNLPVWHRNNGTVAFLTWPDILACDFGTTVLDLLESTWQHPAVLPSGASEAAAVVQEYLLGNQL